MSILLTLSQGCRNGYNLENDKLGLLKFLKKLTGKEEFSKNMLTRNMDGSYPQICQCNVNKLRRKTEFSLFQGQVNITD